MIPLNKLWPQRRRTSREEDAAGGKQPTTKPFKAPLQTTRGPSIRVDHHVTSVISGLGQTTTGQGLCDLSDIGQFSPLDPTGTRPSGVDTANTRAYGQTRTVPGESTEILLRSKRKASPSGDRMQANQSAAVGSHGPFEHAKKLKLSAVTEQRKSKSLREYFVVPTETHSQKKVRTEDRHDECEKSACCGTDGTIHASESTANQHFKASQIPFAQVTRDTERAATPLANRHSRHHETDESSSPCIIADASDGSVFGDAQIDSWRANSEDDRPLVADQSVDNTVVCETVNRVIFCVPESPLIPPGDHVNLGSVNADGAVSAPVSDTVALSSDSCSPPSIHSSLSISLPESLTTIADQATLRSECMAATTPKMQSQVSIVSEFKDMSPAFALAFGSPPIFDLDDDRHGEFEGTAHDGRQQPERNHAARISPGEPYKASTPKGRSRESSFCALAYSPSFERQLASMLDDVSTLHEPPVCPAQTRAISLRPQPMRALGTDIHGGLASRELRVAQANIAVAESCTGPVVPISMGHRPEAREPPQDKPPAPHTHPKESDTEGDDSGPLQCPEGTESSKSDSHRQVSACSAADTHHVRMRLESLGLPLSVLNAYRARGIFSLYEWQAEALSLPGVARGLENLVYSAPTSAGKTMVAELLCVLRVIASGSAFSTAERKRKRDRRDMRFASARFRGRKRAIIVLPFVSIVTEKVKYLSSVFGAAGLEVAGFYGGKGPGLETAWDVAVCTIEKANGLVNRMLEEYGPDGICEELCCVVVDELHTLGDSSRGYILELLLTKVLAAGARAAAKNQPSAPSSGESGGSGTFVGTAANVPRIQIVAMSATLPNLDEFTSWLSARLYVTDFRPVPLTEFVLCGRRLIGLKHDVRELDRDKVVKSFAPPTGSTVSPKKGTGRSHIEPPYGEIEATLALCSETVEEGLSVLVFCAARAEVEKCAVKLAEMASWDCTTWPVRSALDGGPRGGRGDVPGGTQGWVDALDALVGRLRRSPSGLDSFLRATLPKGIAYHHAGLTTEEREEIEDAFARGIVKILVSTTTLASGVNLPARRVILKSIRSLVPYGGGRPDCMRYAQMSGRAGRKGLDTRGECVLVVRDADLPQVDYLLSATALPVHSCLLAHVQQGKASGANDLAVQRAVLEAVVCGIVTTPHDASAYIGMTLLAAQRGDAETSAATARAIESLVLSELVTIRSRAVGADSTGATPVGPLGRKDPTEMGAAVPRQDVSHMVTNHGCPAGAIPSADATTTGAVIEATRLGMATVAASLSPDEAVVLMRELTAARKHFILDGELHTVYHVTPVRGLSDSFSQEAWASFYRVYPTLSSQAHAVMEALGLHEGTLFALSQGRAQSEEVKARWRRFVSAVVLCDIVSEMPLAGVCNRYEIPRGAVQSLQQGAAMYAGMVTAFCERLGWDNMRSLFDSFQQRFDYGVASELCDLVRIPAPAMTRPRARALFNAGIKSVTHVLLAHAETVENILVAALPFESAVAANRSSLLVRSADTRETDTAAAVVGLRIKAEKEAAARILAGARAISEKEQREQDRIADELMGRTVSSDGGFVGATDALSNEDEALNHALHHAEADASEGVWGTVAAGADWTVVDCRDRPDALRELQEEAPRTEGEFAVAVSANGRSLAVTWGVGKRVYHVPFVVSLSAPMTQDAHSTTGEKGDAGAVVVGGKMHEVPLVETLRAVFGHASKVVTFRCKYALRALERMGIVLPGNVAVCDAIVSAWLLNHVADTKGASLDDIARAHLGFVVVDPAAALRRRNRTHEVCAAAVATLRLERLFAPRLLEIGLGGVYIDLEMPAMRVAVAMESHGILFDRRSWRACQAVARVAVSALEAECHRLAGRPFLLSSPDAVARVLYVDLGLNPHVGAVVVDGTGDDSWAVPGLPFESPSKLTLSRRSGLPSTQRDMLERMLQQEAAHPILAALLEWRRLYSVVSREIISVFADDGLQLDDSESESPNRVHPTSDLTATGRMSLSSPCVQHVPSAFCVVHPVAVAAIASQLGTPPLPGNIRGMSDSIVSLSHDTEGRASVTVNPRSAFIAPHGRVFVSADYSQLELRVLAHLSRDDRLCGILRTPGGDVFKLIAAAWMTCDGDSRDTSAEVTPEMRTRAKQLCYGIVYGMGPEKLAQDMGVSEATAARHMADFRARFPVMGEFCRQFVASCRARGYTQTLLGRRRALPDLTLSASVPPGGAKVAERRAQAERQALNTAVQGSAADLVMGAMVSIDRRVGGACAKGGSRGAHLVLQMHDELVYEVDQGVAVGWFAPLLREEMEAQAAKMGIVVPLPVVVRMGTCWGRMDVLSP